MSLFSWLSKKKSSPAEVSYESSGLGHVDATVPYLPGGKAMARTDAAGSITHAANRKTERLERRELLYTVVREAMTRAGVLSASYKFKVLSLDPRGLQYLIMMDLANRSAGEAARLADIETLIAQSAKARHGILVTAVYWRVNEHVTAGLPPSRPVLPTGAEAQGAPVPPVPPVPPLPRRAANPVPVAVRAAPHEPLQEDEVAAFKQALAKASIGAAQPGTGKMVQSGRRNPTPEPEFQDTEMTPSDERGSPLSGTQYGELN